MYLVQRGNVDVVQPANRVILILPTYYDNSLFKTIPVVDDTFAAYTRIFSRHDLE